MSNGVEPQPPQLPKQVYGIFTGIIDGQAIGRISNGLTIAVNAGVEHVHLMFQTIGGNVGDGIFLYNLFRNLPIGLTLYNAGCISSIGVIAYLGAKERRTSASATFMIHKTNFSPVAATSDRLQSAANAAILDDTRVEAILHEQMKLPDDKWALHKNADLWLSADEAIKGQLATALGDFAPPKGQQLFYLGAA